MLIGDSTDFAIEVMVEPALKVPSAVWGRMCVHVGGTTLGDFSDQYCALYPAYGNFDWHAKRVDRLWDTVFNGMTPEEIHDTVRHAIYGDDDRTMDEIQRDSRRFSPFDFLTNWGEQFDGYSSVIVAPAPETVMVLHRPYVQLDSPRRLPDDFLAASCSRDGFCRAAREFVAWFDHEAKRLQQKDA
ncbi:hypothetical protein LOC67_24640 [Stieleria sp. JC731]|uniref:hypothetical protein n=1 Tax=Pirellulaceae TaxID=2691357 RepID=UPI001E3781A5|nr:hypothetical protein [Stieleria sp. JC731]MCC9603751.1 hypothetical protein [Stieleria sp. JC731]